MSKSGAPELRIGETARAAGTPAKTIRYYESIGLLPCTPRAPNGYRAYRSEDVERLRFIGSAQRLGLSLSEIGQVLRLRDESDTPCGYVRDRLAEHVSDIDRQVEGLLSLRRQLLEILAAPASTPPGAQTVYRPLIDGAP